MYFIYFFFKGGGKRGTNLTVQKGPTVPIYSLIMCNYLIVCARKNRKLVIVWPLHSPQKIVYVYQDLK